MLDHDGQGSSAGKAVRDALVPTPTDDVSLPRRYADFATMTEALDYVAQSRLGMNFHDARATLIRVYPYAELRLDALAAAHRFVARGIRPGERIALIAETAAEFVALFFGALYAGIWPVPLPLPTSFGGTTSRMASSTCWNSRSACSMRKPGGARTCSVICPASIWGK